MEYGYEIKRDVHGREYMHIHTIYRFLSFEQFIDIVENKKLTFVNSELWEDPYESFLFSKINTLAGFEEILSVYESLNIEEIPMKIANIFASRNTTYAQSWSMLSESDALWRIYNSNNRSVRLEVKLEKIKELRSKKYSQIGFSPIKYVSEVTCENQVKELYRNDASYKSSMIQFPFEVKRSAFTHEAEFRLFHIDAVSEMMKLYANPDVKDIVSVIFDKNYNYRNNIQEFYYYLNQLQRKFDSPKMTFDINLDNVSDFIESVIVNPFAPEWFVSTVEK